MVNAVNRTTGPLDAMFDGQPVVLVPGYKLVDDPEKEGKQKVVGAGPGESVVTNALPYFAAEMVKRQNPLMGSEDPENPREFESLVGIMEWGDDITHLEQSDKMERIDREMLDDEAQTARAIRTSSGRKADKLKKRGKGGRRFTDPQLKNPQGIRGEYAQ